MTTSQMLDYEIREAIYIWQLVKFSSSQWMVAGAGDPPPNPNTFLHGDSPSTGNSWNSTQNVISFDKMKLTNNRASIMQGQICLHSMHKYQPKIHIQPLGKEYDGLDHGRIVLLMGLNTFFMIFDNLTIVNIGESHTSSLCFRCPQ